MDILGADALQQDAMRFLFPGSQNREWSNNQGIVNCPGAHQTAQRRECGKRLAHAHVIAQTTSRDRCIIVQAGSPLHSCLLKRV